MPELTREQGFAWSLFLFESICLICFAAHFDTANPHNTPIASTNSSSKEDPGRLRDYYPMYMDVHVMIFVGFGFLMAFLRKYTISAVALNFILAVMSAQWGIVMVTAMDQIGDGAFPCKPIDMATLINGDFAAGAVIISFGAVLGKVTPTQLVWMAFFEVVFYAINDYILEDCLGVVDAGGSMLVDTFGAFFGLALTIQIGKPDPHEEVHHTSSYASDTFAMIGTLFLWVYWPSFNAALVPVEGFRQERAVVNTVLSITGSCSIVFATTQMLTQAKKFDLMHLQNATLAGGIAIGASCDLAISPAVAITTGLIAGILSVLGYRFLSPRLERVLHVSDSAGIFNLHGMSGIIGGLTCALNTAVISDEYYGADVTSIYEARAYRSAIQQAGYQLFGVVVTLGIAVVAGTLVGALLSSSNFRQQQMKYEDHEWFHVPANSNEWKTVLSQVSYKEGGSNSHSQPMEVDFLPMI
ncbi:hypothetical protein BBJ28_00013940 [Nothophytophthora sp. Chile5]|nr:hypothetical protein BBJ28_00013940 [Nothophytophthora sp. Chile5]